MACFLVPAAEAVVVTIVSSRVAAKEEAMDKPPIKSESWARRLSWLKSMLWGGSLLLLLEHIWHGEVVLWPPFLTAMLNPSDTAEMLHEMAIVGVGMAVLVTAVWGLMVLVVSHTPALRRRVFRERA